MCPNKWIKLVVATILSFVTAYLISIQAPSTSKLVAVVGVLGIVTILPLGVIIISFLIRVCFLKLRTMVADKSSQQPIEPNQLTDEQTSVTVLLLDGGDSPNEYNFFSPTTKSDSDSQHDLRISARKLWHVARVANVEFEETSRNVFSPLRDVETDLTALGSMRESIASYFKQRRGTEYSK